MTQEHIAKTIDIIAKVASQDLPGVTAETTIKALPIDSLDLYSVLSDLENETGRSMDDEQMQALRNVGDLVKHFFG